MKYLSATGLALALAAPVCAQDTSAEPGQAAGLEVFVSADSDDTDVVRAAVDFDLRHAGEDRYLGVRVEQARYKFRGREREDRERVFLRAADTLGAWQWRAQVGTDGDTVIGSISAHDNAPFRKEVFVERDIVETPLGVERGIYSTFAGAAIDLPADERNVFTVLAGVQAFTGKNTRLHLRGNYIHVVKPEWGLSAQLRGRYFRSSAPGEFDYYSPRSFAEALPVIQVRRFVGGWRLLGAAGLGAQRDSSSGWRQARYAHASVRSPADGAWSIHASVTYSNTPALNASSDSSYSYVQGTFGLSRRF